MAVYKGKCEKSERPLGFFSSPGWGGACVFRNVWAQIIHREDNVTYLLPSSYIFGENTCGRLEDTPAVFFSRSLGITRHFSPRTRSKQISKISNRLISYSGRAVATINFKPPTPSITAWQLTTRSHLGIYQCGKQTFPTSGVWWNRRKNRKVGVRKLEWSVSYHVPGTWH